MSKYPENIQYSFCPNVAWSLDDGIVIPYLNKQIFDKIKEQANNFYVLCPGFLLESLIAARANDLFIRSGIKIKKWIMPDVYAKAASKIGLKYKGSSGDIFVEYKRMKRAKDSYPTPIFMDEDNNVYFNLLCNYGKRVNYQNNPAANNEEPCWKQILKNTLVFDNYEYKEIEFDLEDICNSYLINNGIDTSKRFVIIDNSNIFGIPAHGFKIRSQYIFPEQARDIAGYLYDKGIQCVIMTNNKKDYYGRNLFTINSWNNVDLVDLLALLNNAHGVLSSDPNIYLSAAIMGCRNIFCSDDPNVGWRIEDLDGFCKVDGKYIYNIDLNIKDIAFFFGTEEF